MNTRHEQLLAAGWRYDARTHRYTAPDAPRDGTAPSYNLEAAWQAHQARTVAPTPGIRRSRDPRQQEPQ